MVPAFEYKVEEDPKDSKYFPDTKKELIPLIEKGDIRVFHDSFPPGHAATDTPRWMRMNPDVPNPGNRWMTDERQKYLEQEAEGERPYKVTNFEPKYEPYIILKREGTPWCDERFVGYGANKAVCFSIRVMVVSLSFAQCVHCPYICPFFFLCSLFFRM